MEAELGRLEGVEDDVVVGAEDASYADPDEVEEFVTRTGCDSLLLRSASHGAYKFADKTATPLRYSRRDRTPSTGFLLFCTVPVLSFRNSSK